MARKDVPDAVPAHRHARHVDAVGVDRPFALQALDQFPSGRENGGRLGRHRARRGAPRHVNPLFGRRDLRRDEPVSVKVGVHPVQQSAEPRQLGPVVRPALARPVQGDHQRILLLPGRNPLRREAIPELIRVGRAVRQRRRVAVVREIAVLQDGPRRDDARVRRASSSEAVAPRRRTHMPAILRNRPCRRHVADERAVVGRQLAGALVRDGTSPSGRIALEAAVVERRRPAVGVAGAAVEVRNRVRQEEAVPNDVPVRADGAGPVRRVAAEYAVRDKLGIQQRAALVGAVGDELAVDPRSVASRAAATERTVADEEAVRDRRPLRGDRAAVASAEVRDRHPAERHRPVEVRRPDTDRIRDLRAVAGQHRPAAVSILRTEDQPRLTRETEVVIGAVRAVGRREDRWQMVDAALQDDLIALPGSRHDVCERPRRFGRERRSSSVRRDIIRPAQGRQARCHGAQRRRHHRFRHHRFRIHEKTFLSHHEFFPNSNRNPAPLQFPQLRECADFRHLW